MLLIYYPHHTILSYDFVIARLIYLQGAYRCTSGFVPAADLFRLIKCASVRLRTCCPSDFQTLLSSSADLFRGGVELPTPRNCLAHAYYMSNIYFCSFGHAKACTGFRGFFVVYATTCSCKLSRSNRGLYSPITR